MATDDRLPRGLLERSLETPGAKHRYVRQLFGTIADRYDLITRLLSFGRDQSWKARLVDLSGVGAGMRVLDLACGTGDIALLSAARGASAVGLDFTPRMIELARARSGAAAWLVGDMSALPVPDEAFDVVTTGYGLRNVPDLPIALGEIHRVLKPGGRVGALDFDRPESAASRAVFLTYLGAVGSTLGAVLHGNPDTYRYIPASIRRYPGAQAVAGLFRDAGFVDVHALPLFGGFLAIHLARKS